MCIIAAKPAGTKMPDQETIRRMWYGNPDGAGIMYALDGKVRIEKGFMKLSDLEARLDEIRKTYDLSILMTTHDFSMLERYADQAVLMDHTVLAAGTPGEVLGSRAFREVFHMKGGSL